VQRAVAVAKREKVTFPLNKAYSLPHRIDGYWGAAKVMLRPAADGAGVIAGECAPLPALPCLVLPICFAAQRGAGPSLPGLPPLPSQPAPCSRACVVGLRCCVWHVAASEGSCLRRRCAGGAVRVVLEMAGVRNCFGKQLGSANPLNNARATVEGLRALRTFKQVCCGPRRRSCAAVWPS
jgi:ribosomal protein S5